ncbi:hypothetical protein B566_EDAN016544 [Ephemera danica]|nr:hypothetical protein B566_EDAN016544 [Ephemera danica]
MQYFTGEMNGRPVCELCNKFFARLQRLHKHQRQSCPHKKCATCRSYFWTVGIRKQHEKVCTKSCVPRSTCDYCEKTFVQRSDMLYHQRTSCKGRGIGPRVSTSSVKVECSTCHRKFASTKSLYQHRKQHCPARNEQMFKCDKCKSIFVSKVSLYKHMQRQLNLEMNSIRCTECDVVVPKKQIQKHKREECVNRNRVGGPIRRHSRDLPDGVVVSQTAFNKMLTNYEFENNDDKCDLEVFLEQQRYAIEEIFKHDLFKEEMNGRPVCELCNKSFARLQGLHKHQRQSCPHKKCATCRSYFWTVGLRKQHEKVCTKSCVPRSTCDYCEKTFVQRSDINRVGGPIRRHSRDLPDGVVVSQTAFNKMLTNYEFENNDDKCDLEVFLEQQRYAIEEIFKHDLFVKNAIKMNMALHIKIENTAGETSPWAFRTSNVEIYL